MLNKSHQLQYGYQARHIVTLLQQGKTSQGMLNKSHQLQHGYQARHLVTLIQQGKQVRNVKQIPSAAAWLSSTPRSYPATTKKTSQGMLNN